MFEREDISIRLKSKELSGGNHQATIVGWIQKVQLRCNLDTEKQCGASKWFCPFGMHQQEIILANLRNDKGMCGLDIGSIVSLVHTDKLTTSLAHYRKMVFDVGKATVCILLVFEKDVKALLGCFHPQSFLCPFLTNQVLFQRQQGPFVGCVLANLNQCIPIMGCKVFFAVRTLSIFLDEFDYFALLDPSVLIDRSDILNFELDSLGVRLGPQKFGIFQLLLSQSFYFFQKDSEQFWTFASTVDPRRSLIPQAVCAIQLLLSG